MQNTKPRTGGFKPRGIRPPAIISLMVISLVLAAVIEFLAQRSQRKGGLSLVETADDVSTTTTFAYMYAPTIISVIYGLTWAWIDLDARRMQPWVELSRPEGAEARDSLLLNYPFGFLAFVPIQACRRKHWPVFFSGTALVLIFWGVTPLQSAIFGTEFVEVSENIPALPAATLIPVGEQAVRMDSSLLVDAYGVSWLDQEFPAFTTADYAVLPVFPADGLEPSPKELWTAKTTKLSAELNCWPANITRLEGFKGRALYDNGRGCSVDFSSLNSIDPGESTLVYIGYKDDAYLDFSLQLTGRCKADAANQFLAIWSKITNETEHLKFSDREYHLTAAFCETSYSKQEVSVTIARNESRPIDVVALGPTKTLDGTEFNSTAYEQFLNVGRPPVSKTRDVPATETLEAYPALENFDIAFPATNMVIYALGLVGKRGAALQNQTLLHEAFTAAHKAMFSLAIPRLLSPTEALETTEGVRKQTKYGVVISRPISAVVEALLFLVVILASGLLIAVQRSPCKLSHDPAGMGFTFRILKASQAILDRFTDQDSADDKTLRECLAGERYALVEDDSAPEGLKLEVMRGNGLVSPASTFRQHISYLPVHPDWLRAFTGAIFISGLAGGIALLVYLKIKEQDLNGLPRPSENFVVLQILENYVPMVFCTLLEPFLVLLTRLLCVIQPFKDLQKGGSTADKTIETRYTSLPPQLLILHSLKSRHFMLAALSLLTILAQVLAVGLGGVFQEEPVVVSYPAMSRRLRTTNLTRDLIFNTSLSILDYRHHYVASSNYSSNTRLPAWTAPDFAFLPVNLTEETTFSRGMSEPTFRVQVRGFGAEPKCIPLPTDSSARPAYANISGVEDGLVMPTYAYQHPNGSMVTCQGEPSKGQNVTGISSRQYTTSLHSNNEDGGGYGVPVDGGFCRERFVMGWLRADSSDFRGSLKSTFITCEALLQTAMFDVEFSLDGKVRAYERVGEFEDPSQFMSENMTRELIRQGNRLIGVNYGGDYRAWNNESIATDWMNYNLKAKLNSADLIDPTKPVPSHDFVIPLVEEMYQRSYALVSSLHLSLFQETPPDDPAFLVQGQYMVEETRIFLEDPALYISLAIMALNIVVLVAVYYMERHPFLPRLPSTIGSQIAYVAASRMVRGYGGKGDGTSPGSTWNTLLDRDSLDVGEGEGERGDLRGGRGIEQDSVMLEGVGGERGKMGTGTTVTTEIEGEKTNQLVGQTYSFGRYRGVDGNMHVGIEVDPLVTGIDKSMLQKRQSTFGSWMSGEERERERSPVDVSEGGSLLGSWFRRRKRKRDGWDEGVDR